MSADGEVDAPAGAAGAESGGAFELVDLPSPRVDATWAARTAAERFGVEAHARDLGSNQDANFLLVGADAEPLAVLKVAHPAFSLESVAWQDRAADHVAAACPDLRIAQVMRASDGTPLRAVVDTPDGPAVARLIRYLDGGTLADRGYLSPAANARLGEVAARMDVALSDLGTAAHPAGDPAAGAGPSQWDLRYADRVIAALATALPEDRRPDVLAAAETAWSRLAEVASDLPVQTVHLDATDDNTIIGAHGLVDGVIDFGDIALTWTVSELAIAGSSILHHPGSEAADVLSAIRAYDAVRPLSGAEAVAVWPLLVLRAAVLVVSGCHQVAVDAGLEGGNAYAEGRLCREWRIFEQATSVPLEVMTALIRQDLQHEAPTASPVPAPAGALATLTDSELIDLSSVSPLLDDGAWLEPDVVEQIASRLLASGRPAVVTRFREARLAGMAALAQEAPASVATGIDVWTAEPVALQAPWDGDLRAAAADRLVLTREGLELVIAGVNPTIELEGGVRAGERLGSTPPGERTRITLGRRASEVPEAVRAAYAPGWLAGLADPAPLFGLPPSPVAGRGREDPLLVRRHEALAGVQEHYYRRPPRIERGWRHHLVTDEGRPLLDIINNVASVGHAHPRVRAAAHRQLALLNTNSRFHYEAIAEFAGRLADLAPDPIDTVFLVNSGSEAADLAIRLAMVSTGRDHMVAMTEAYHGWTYASDAVSTSIADNPQALETRPAWVHTVPAANPYRGLHRGDDAAAYAPEAVAIIDDLATTGRVPAGFIAEAYYGNAGGMPLPDGYLAEVYAAVRRHGGLAIADEIQVGLGRLGRWFWGFEQQGVVPDVIAVAKGLGSGSPVGAVLTTRAIADAYRGAGYFFSSTGGSPVSACIGLAVLDVLHEERLADNARVVGDHLAGRLRALADRHPLIGAVHGHGLYLGVELVRDRESLEPADIETAAICERMLDLGVVVQPTSDRQNVLKVKPPLCLDTAGADFFVDTLDRVLTQGW